MDFSNVRVLVVGDIVLDKYTIGTVNRISPEAPVPILNVEEEFYRLGGAANVAANIAALGGSVSLVGLVGDDVYGDKIARECGKQGVLLRAIESPLPTSLKNRFIAGRQQLLRVDWEDTDVSSFSELAKDITEQSLLLADNSDVVLVSDYGKGVVSGSLISSIRSVLPKALIIVDPKPINAARYTGASIIKPNEKEAKELLLALGCGLCPTVQDTASRLSVEYKTKIVITRGEKGMVLADAQVVQEIPTEAQEIFDVTGAGDAVTACLGLALGSGMSLVESCRLANIAGGIAVGHVGVVAVTSRELFDIAKGKLDGI
jgi:D-beta-D-heptose 7-phosphate kinase/D-beta-D-heptose 1-phosphate adenosyltransferase